MLVTERWMPEFSSYSLRQLILHEFDFGQEVGAAFVLLHACLSNRGSLFARHSHDSSVSDGDEDYE